MFWSAARLVPQRERLALHCLALGGYRTYVPRIRERRIRHGRKVVATPALFPGYAFILIELEFYRARKTPGIIDLVMDLDKPARVPDAVIAELHARERNGLIRLPPPPKPATPFLPADRLRVHSGPLTGLNGLYAGMAPHERIFVLLQMLGGPRVVELARTAVVLAP